MKSSKRLWNSHLVAAYHLHALKDLDNNSTYIQLTTIIFLRIFAYLLDVSHQLFLDSFFSTLMAVGQ